MLLALGALIILILIISNTTKTTQATEDVFYNSNFGITAVSLATSVIEDASKKRFDNIYYIDSSTVTDPNSFTTSGTLGIEAGEDINDPATFNDFDDYDGFEMTDTVIAKYTAPFKVECSVNYVNENDLDGKAGSQTFHKKITVTVTSEFMQDTITMSSIYSYWNFLP